MSNKVMHVYSMIHIYPLKLKSKSMGYQQVHVPIGKNFSHQYILVDKRPWHQTSAREDLDTKHLSENTSILNICQKRPRHHRILIRIQIACSFNNKGIMMSRIISNSSQTITPKLLLLSQYHKSSISRQKAHKCMSSNFFFITPSYRVSLFNRTIYPIENLRYFLHI